MALDFRLLGPLEATLDGRPLALGGEKQRAVLAALLLRRGRPCRSEELVEAVWGESAPATAANAVQGYVSRLRKLLGEETIATRGQAYVLDADALTIDAVRFEQLAEEGREALRRGDMARAATLLADALALWRGRPLSDVTLEGAWATEARRLEELRLAALEDRVDADLALGRHSELVPELDTLLADQGLRERLWGQLMLALYRSGRQADALDAYRRARATLVDELGIEPSPALQELERSILNQEAGLVAPAAAVARLTLPSPATPLVGREAELERAAELVDDGARLVTFAGPGGIGKTRLALELAQRLAPRYDEGAAFVSLAAVNDPALVGPTIAAALGLSPDDDLLAALRGRSLLLVLDNFEQVVAAATLVSDLLAASERVAVLVTSREALRLSAEHDFAVPPLAEADAETLFVRRAQAVVPDFDPERERESVAAICERLERLPLAVELAAARVKLLPPPALLERLSGQLDLLAAGPRDAPERHQTMRATIDWSFRMLDEHDQRLLAGLAVFVGGAELELAEAVAGDGGPTLDGLASLVEKSLLRQRGDRTPRFVMLETVREFALEQLVESSEADAVRRRHAEAFLALAEEAEQPSIQGPDTPGWLARLEREHGNFRAALEFAFGHGDATTAICLASGLRHFWYAHGHLTEGRRWLERALEAAPEAPPLLRNKVWNGIGVIAGEQGDFAGSKHALEQSAALAHELGDRRRAATAMANLGNVALFQADGPEARKRYVEASALLGELGDTRGLAIATENLGHVELLEGNVPAALERFEQSIRLAEDAGDLALQASSLRAIARIRVLLDDLEGAGTAVRRALALDDELETPHALAQTFEAAGAAAAAAGRPADGAALFGHAAALRQGIGAQRPPDQHSWYEQREREIREALGPDAYAAELARGAALSGLETRRLVADAHKRIE